MSEPPDGSGLAVHAIVRNRRTERALDALQRRAGDVEYRLVDEDDLSAVVTEAPFARAEPDESQVRHHAELIAGLLRRSSVVPLPFGVRARGEGAVRAFLGRQRVALREALDWLDDCYELRLHVSRAPGRRDANARPRAHQLYEELRRQARAARILSEDSEATLLSAAFLLPRAEWIRFVERTAAWESAQPGLRVDVTGPWAAYDFVQFAESDIVLQEGTGSEHGEGS